MASLDAAPQELSLLQAGAFREAAKLLSLALPGSPSLLGSSTGCRWTLSDASIHGIVSSTVDGLIKGSAQDDTAIAAALELLQVLVQRQPVHQLVLLHAAGGAILHGYAGGAVLRVLDDLNWQLADAETPDGFEACMSFINRTLGTRAARLASDPELGRRMARIGSTLAGSRLMRERTACLRLSEPAHRALMALLCGQGMNGAALEVG